MCPNKPHQDSDITRKINLRKLRAPGVKNALEKRRADLQFFIEEIFLFQISDHRGPNATMSALILKSKTLNFRGLAEKYPTSYYIFSKCDNSDPCKNGGTCFNDVDYPFAPACDCTHTGRLYKKNSNYQRENYAIIQAS